MEIPAGRKTGDWSNSCHPYMVNCHLCTMNAYRLPCHNAAGPARRYQARSGTPQEPPPIRATREERRVVTVLFVDMVGFTSLASSLDPEDVRALQTEYFAAVTEVVHRWNGVVEKYVGDAVMAVFGVPRSDGYDAFRAVRAGMQLRKALHDRFMPSGRLVRTRVGIATGEALVDLAAAVDGGQGFVSGNVVNTAARVQTHTAADTVIVTNSTHNATKSFIRYRQLPPATVAGKPEPLELWRPLEVTTGPTAADHGKEVPLVGRRAELGAMAGWIERAYRDGTPQVLSVVGPAGSGKSRLVRELAHLVGAGAGEPVRWRITRCSLDGSLAEALAEMTGGPVAVDGASSTVASQQPAVLVIEDLHCADAATTGAVRELVTTASRPQPSVIIITYRPDIQDFSWFRADHTVHVGSLDAAETSLLLRQLLHRAGQPPTLVRQLLPLACGNPMYAEAYVEELAGQGTPARSDAGLATPEPVRAAVSARLDRLDPADRAAVFAASVLGQQVTAGALAFLLRTDRDHARTALRRLEKANLIVRQPVSTLTAWPEYNFTDPAVSAVAYSQLPRTARTDHHGRATQWLDGLSQLTRTTGAERRARPLGDRSRSDTGTVRRRTTSSSSRGTVRVRRPSRRHRPNARHGGPDLPADRHGGAADPALRSASATVQLVGSTPGRTAIRGRRPGNGVDRGARAGRDTAARRYQRSPCGRGSLRLQPAQAISAGAPQSFDVVQRSAGPCQLADWRRVVHQNVDPPVTIDRCRRIRPFAARFPILIRCNRVSSIRCSRPWTEWQPIRRYNGYAGRRSGRCGQCPPSGCLTLDAAAVRLPVRSPPKSRR